MDSQLVMKHSCNEITHGHVTACLRFSMTYRRNFLHSRLRFSQTVNMPDFARVTAWRMHSDSATIDIKTAAGDTNTTADRKEMKPSAG